MNQKNLTLYKISKLINTTGNLVYPLITYVLLKTLHIEDAYIGVLIMVVSIVKIPGILIGGKLGDRYNHKIIASIPPILCGIALIACAALLEYKYAVIVLMCLSKFMSGIGSPSNVKIMDSLVSDTDRKSVFAQLYLITNIGTAIASLAGGMIYAYSCVLVFLLDGITRLASGLLLIRVKVAEMPQRAAVKTPKDKVNVFQYITSVKGLWGYIILTMLFIYIYSQYSYAVPLQLDQEFGTNSSQLFSIVLFINCMTVVLTTKLFEKLCKNSSVLKCLAVSFACFLLGFGLYCFEMNVVMLIVSSVIWSCGEVIFGINELVFISETVEKSYFARTVSVYDSLQNVVLAVSPMINSVFVVTVGLKTSWYVIAVLAFAGSAVSLMFVNMSRVRITPDMEG